MTAAEMAAIHAACFVTPRPWSAANITATLDSAFAFVLSEPQGFLLGRAVAGEAELLTLAVAPEARNRGIGGRLVTAFLAEAMSRGAESAFLEVSAANLPAQRLYAAKGFELQGKRRAYYQTPEGDRLDALVLTCRL